MPSALTSTFSSSRWLAGLAILLASAVGLAGSGCHSGRPRPSTNRGTIATERIAQPLTNIPVVTNSSNFNGTAIAAGRYIWFTSVFKVTGVGTAPAHLYFNASHITFTAGGVNYDLPVPDSELTIDPGATTATTSFNTSTGTWQTTLPKTFSGNGFLSALAYPVPANLPGGINPVTWSGSFESDVDGLTVKWVWAAAVYTSFSSDYNALQVKPVDGSSLSVYQNSDHAGTPEAYKAHVIGGARGGGGSNYTGSLSGTVTVLPTVPCAGVTCPAPGQCHAGATCNPTSGVCSFTNKPDGTACNDENLCTQSDTCQAGTCTGSNPVTCTALDQCHAAGMCDPGTGTCSNPSVVDGTQCDDSDACTQTDTCVAGACTGNNPKTCTALDQCHVPGICDPGSGVCSNPNRTDGTTCVDGDACTQTDTCQGGDCVGASPVVCEAQDQCHVAGTCDPASGLCSNPNKADGTECADGNACTQSDTCQAGTCVGANPRVCTALDQCHDAGLCDPMLGTCSNPAKTDGVACTDGNACTQTDTCQAGSCTGGNPVTCTPASGCSTPGTCDPETGTCSASTGCNVCGNGVAETPEQCDDGNTVNGDGCSSACATELCFGITCAAQDSCHQVGVCDPATGQCTNPAKEDGTSCSDSNVCNGHETCQQGTCTAGAPPPPPSVMTLDACHEAKCDATLGWRLMPKEAGTTCTTGNSCLVIELCDALGFCGGGTSVANGTACASGSCQAGQCVAPACTPPPAGVAWWPGDGNGADVLGGNHASMQGSATFATGQVGQSLAFNGFDSVANAGHAPSLNVSAGDFTLDTWVTFNGSAAVESFTIDADFDRGTLTNLNHAPLNDQLQINGGTTYGNWSTIVDGKAFGRVWRRVDMSSTIPPLAVVTIEVRAANTVAELASAKARFVPSGTPFDGITGRFLQVKVGMTRGPAPGLPRELFIGNDDDASLGVRVVDPDTGALKRTISSTGQVTGIAFDGEHLFFNSASPNLSIPNFQERTADGATTLRTFFIKPKFGYEDSAWDIRRRRLWTCDLFGYLARIDLQTNKVEANYNLFNPTRCVGVAYDSNRDLVYVSHFFGEIVVKVDPDSGQVLGQLFSTSGKPYGVAGLAYDALTDTLWVGQGFGGGLWNLDLTGNAIKQVPTDSRNIDGLELVSPAVGESPVVRDVTVYADAAVAGDMVLIDKMSTKTSSLDGWRLVKQNDNRLSMCFGGGTVNGCEPGGPLAVQSTSPVTADTWTHVAAVKSGNDVSLYINGAFNASKTLAGPFTDSGTADLRFGPWLSGRLDEVELFSRALTSSEVRAIFEAGQNGKCKTPAANQAPRVAAGDDRSVTLADAPGAAILEGVVADDGLPGATATATWTQVSGPAPVTFADASSPRTSASIPQPGTYVLRLSATDGALSASDDVTVTATTGVCGAPPAGLIGWWPGDASGTDVSRGYNAVLRNGASFAEGRVGPAFAFDGFNDFAIAGKPATVSGGDFTADAWVLFRSLERPLRPASSSGGHMSLIDKMSPTGINRDGWRLLKNDDHTFGFCFGGGDVDGCQSGGPLTVQSVTRVRPQDLNSWFHVAAVKSGDQISIYVNGALEASKILGQGFTDTGVAELVLGSNVLSQSFLDGLLDEVQLFNRALSAAEVQQLYQLGTSGQCKAPRPTVNQAPQVSAGADTNVVFPSEAAGSALASLNGSVLDDGLPGAPLTSNWTKISGPGTVVFGDVAQATTTAKFSLAGAYVLRLSATDSLLAASDDVTVTVTAPVCTATGPGPIAWWPADGTGKDLQGTNDVVPKNGALFGAGKVLETFVFDGTDDHANAGHAASLNVSGGDFSVDAWVLFHDTSEERSIVDKMSATGNNADGWRLLKGGDGKLRFCLGGGATDGCAAGGPLAVQGTTSLSTGTWYHVAAVKRATILTLYLNGVRQAAKALGASFTDTGQADLILAAHAGQSAFLAGWIDEVDLFDRALSETEVRAIYNAGQLGKCKPNQPPRVSVGLDQILHLPPSAGVPATTTLVGTVADDKLPTNTLTTTWTKVSGPGTVTFGTPSAATTSVSLSAAGDYVLRLTASDGQLSASDDLVVTVTPPFPNAAPTVSCGVDRSIRLPVNNLALSCSVMDDGQPGPMLVPTWSKVAGPGNVTFTNTTVNSATATFSAQGTYTVRLQVSDTVLIGFDEVEVTVLPTNQAPVASAGQPQTLSLPMDGSVTTQIIGSFTDDGIPGTPVTTLWSVVATMNSPVIFGDTTRLVTTATFTQTGSYFFTLTANDGLASSTSDFTQIDVVTGNRPPVVNAGADRTITLPTRTVMLAGTATDDGLPSGSTLVRRWSAVAGPGAVVFGNPLSLTSSATFDSPGTYVLRLTVNDSELAASDDMVVIVNGTPPTGSPPVVAITSPGDLTNVTAPIDVRGTVASGSLLGWRLEYREKSLGDDWRTIATGTTPLNDAVLGQFDPTLLLNGIYQLRLVATDTSGRTAETPEDQPSVNVRGNFKVGQFTLSFLELSVPVSGIPIQLLRNYDSRDTRKGDFGYGWTLDASGVRVSESGKMGRNWTVLKQPGFLPSYCVQPTRGKHVTVTANGRTFEFEAVLEDGCETFFTPSLVTVTFRALAGTNATLQPADGGVVLFVEGELFDANSNLYDPDRYVLTLLDGTQLVVADRTAPEGPGLKSISDTNRNTLTFTPSGIFHSGGLGLTINRDSEKRITSIIDPAGNPYYYTYDVDGNLASATDPVGNRTQFKYETAFPHHLKDIIDPRGIRAVRNTYDPSGRLISTADAVSKSLTYTHDLANRKEVVVSRTGDVSTFEFDVRGNITKETDAEGGITTRTFDAHDNILTKTDPNNHTWTYTYDANDLEASVKDPLGKITTRTYHPLGKLLTETDPLGHTRSNGYDIFGNVVSTKDGLGNTTTYAYSPDAANLRTVTDHTGRATSYLYDRNGFLTQSRDRLGNVTTYGNDLNGRRITETKTRTTPVGVETLVTSFVYDSNGRIIETRRPDGSVVKTTYNAIGKVATTVDALGRTTSMTYDNLGQLTRTTYPDTKFEENGYDDSGRRITAKDTAGRTTGYQYDRLGRLVKTTYPDSSFTRTGYDPGGRVTSSTDERGKVTTFGYDDADRRTTVTDHLGHTTTSTYDEAGRNTSIKDARGFTTSFTYDDANRRTETIFPDATHTTTTYDELNNRTSETDQAGRTTRFAYDFEGRLLRVTDALEQVTSYSYDEAGNRVSQIDANLHETRFEYDKLGRQTKRILPGGKFEAKGYDLQGRVTSRTDFMNRTTTFQYDQRDRLTLKTYPNSTTVAFTYTATGRRLTAVDARGTTAYVYDQRDRPTQLTYPDGRKLNYGYDPHGNRTSLTAVVGSTSLTTAFTYDDRNLVSTATDPDNREYRYTYDQNGSPATLAQPNGVTTAYGYDNLSRLTSLVSKRGTTTLASHAYTLGLNGLRARVDEAGGISRAYGYDQLNRLTSETVTGADAGDYSKTFTYDPAGNRLTQVTTGAGAAPVGYTYDARDRLLTESGVTYTYDDNGNRISRSGDATYTWDFDDRLVKVTKANGAMVDHVYDVDGNRVRTTMTPAGGGPPVVTDFLTDTTTELSQVVVESDGAGAVGAYYVRAGNDLLGVRRGPAPAYYLEDGLGSVRGLTDATGVVTDTKSYSAYGETRGGSGTDPQPYGFAGEALEPISGLAYHRARWMDPRTGSFVSMDPAEGDLELPTTLNNQLYAGANPVNYLDPTGRNYGNIASTLGGIVITANLAVQQFAARAGQVFSSGVGQRIGQFFQQLGAQAEAQAFQVLLRMKDQFNLPYMIDRSVQVGRRVIDFGLRIDGQRILMELKYQIPQGGAALTRLVGQMQAALETGDEVVLISFREVARTGNLQNALGSDFSKIRIILGFNDLVTYLVARMVK